MKASLFGHIEVVECLVSKGADLDAANNVRYHVIYFVFEHIVM